MREVFQARNLQNFVTIIFHKYLCSVLILTATCFYKAVTRVRTQQKAMQVYENMGSKVFSIPLRSPDLNPIENFFHSISVKINEDSLNKIITHETFQEFSERVKSIIVNYPTLKINKIIDSIDKRINMIIQHKGQRIKC